MLMTRTPESMVPVPVDMPSELTAAILVSQPIDEVFAVGTSRTEDGPFTIYISASVKNLLTLNRARRHIEDVWERLSLLADERPQRGIGTPPGLELSTSFIPDHALHLSAL